MKAKDTARIIFVLLVLGLFSVLNIVEAHAVKERVLYSGFAFLGEHADIKSQYKYSDQIYNLNNAEGRPLVEKMLSEIMQKTDSKNIEIITGELGQLDSGEGLAMAIALDWEDVAVETLEEGLIKAVYNLHGQILFFDFIKMEVVASYPFGVRVTDCTSGIPSEEHKLEIFKKLYLSDIAGVNFLDSLCSLLTDAEVKSSASNLTFKVEDVVLEAKANEFVVKNFPNDREEAFKIFVAQQFSSFFAKNLKTSILPYTKGKAIGNKMAGRFANGDVFELTVPDGDYPITIAIRGFKKVKLDENGTGESWVYGSYVRLIVESALGDVVNSKIKNGAVKIVPAGQLTVADSSAFVESLLVLFDKTTKQIEICDSDWLKKCAEGSCTGDQFQALKQKINKY
ncbi:hypothetical protein [Maridesulfovibrio frigidus]|uniref:hypothetical protein n=1 Tax=Maridesulfovibrio frigidus TaxID=340956 RepID=UPI0004E1AAD3|nr:hypothetical protein [Maridesulfovibrio frigidus]